jgi:hypothetical protein
MNVFLGLRYCIWSKNEAIENIAESANSILKKGITA